MTLTSVAAAMLCKLVTEKVVIWLPQSILWGNTLQEWVILTFNDFPGIDRDEQKSYLLQRLNLVTRRLLEIQTTPPHGHPAHLSAHEPILIVTMPKVAETIKPVIDKITHGTDFKQGILWHSEEPKIAHDYLTTSIDEPDTRWNIHLVSYDNINIQSETIKR
jgi:hypothetical protein